MNAKKISFSFSKLKKKSAIIPQQQENKEEVEYITSFNNENIQLPEKKEELIIPMKNDYSVAERLMAKKRKAIVENENDTSLNSDNKNILLENLAIQELLADSKNLGEQTNSDLAIPTIDSLPEITNIDPDYNTIPVSEFGYAMVRGMGWKPGQGIGKKQKVVEVRIPESRVRRLGLGADASVKD
ncbi:hypothetical protein PGB90_000518 [Kerria lacca]